MILKKVEENKKQEYDNKNAEMVVVLKHDRIRLTNDKRKSDCF